MASGSSALTGSRKLKSRFVRPWPEYSQRRNRWPTERRQVRTFQPARRPQYRDRARPAWDHPRPDHGAEQTRQPALQRLGHRRNWRGGGDRAFAGSPHRGRRRDEGSQVIVFVVDAQQGLTPIDQELARLLRRSQRPVILAVNKIDHAKHENFDGEFQRLGFKELLSISAAHSRGIDGLVEAIETRGSRKKTPSGKPPKHRFRSLSSAGLTSESRRSSTPS